MQQIELWLDLFRTSVIAFGVLIALLQLGMIVNGQKQNMKLQKQNHDWNRRFAAQEAIRYGNSLEHAKHLEAAFEMSGQQEALSFDEIEQGFKKDPLARAALLKTLNFSEGLARGIEHGIYDEAVIRDSHFTALIKRELVFSNFINHRRKNGSPRAWRRMSTLAAKWRAEADPQVLRELTA